MPKAQVIHVKGTLKKSLRTLRRRGICVAYGHASGPPDPVDIVAELGARGSLYITRPAIWELPDPAQRPAGGGRRPVRGDPGGRDREHRRPDLVPPARRG